MKANKLEVDMALFQTVQDFVAWKQQGVLLNFKPDGFDQIAPVFRDEDGAFTTTKVNRSSMPTTARRSRRRTCRSRRSISSSRSSWAS